MTYTGGYDRRGIRNFIDESVQIGLGTTVWHYAVILADCDIGVGVSIGSHSEIGFRCRIGAQSRISKGVFLPSDSVVGHHVFIGPNVTFTDDRFPKVPKPDDPPYHAQPPIIEDHASIGAGAVILPGVRIGAHALVGAGAVVTKDVPAHAIIRGEPARVRSVA